MMNVCSFALVKVIRTYQLRVAIQYWMFLRVGSVEDTEL